MKPTQAPVPSVEGKERDEGELSAYIWIDPLSFKYTIWNSKWMSATALTFGELFVFITSLAIISEPSELRKIGTVSAAVIVTKLL